MSAGLSQIMESAFWPNSILGEALQVFRLQQPCVLASRAESFNEAGLGSAPIAAAAAKTDHQAVRIHQHDRNLFDTIIVCTLTGLAIACSGALGTLDANGELVTGASLNDYRFYGTRLAR